ncbi:hypothetical protein AB0A95_15675 [Micromonospora sp. NPDC049230]|uniref:hypothetical protein n=1 Tax=Micromonospora sp. NPDC049230 TaxID=3155502 RepID=UPI00340B13B6
MPILVYEGEESNLKVLADDLAAHPDLAGVCTVTINSADASGQGVLRHGALAEIAITIASGVVTSAVYDTIRLLADRARDRGKVVEKTDRPDDEQDR